MHEKGNMSTKSVSGGDSCVKCHNGIESIRDQDSDMMKQIVALGQAVGDTGGCTICHGGNPNKGSVKNIDNGVLFKIVLFVKNKNYNLSNSL